jgi:putative SOS response-associated peptidase YedK
MRWGMVPHFAKSLADFKGFSTINAKSEAVTTKPMWRDPFRRRRCLVPADGFYEWETLDAKRKQPYAFTMRSGEPFAFGGIWDAWKEPDGGWLQSFAIITTDPNELTATVHDRMRTANLCRELGIILSERIAYFTRQRAQPKWLL